MVISKYHTLARQIGERLLNDGLVYFTQRHELLFAKIESFLTVAFDIETSINNEAKALLAKYEQEMDKSQIDSHKMFLMIKKKLIRERNLILQSDPTITPDDKINHLAHLIQQGLDRDPDVDMKADGVALLSTIKHVLTMEMQQEEAIREIVKKRLASYKRNILEGTDEWDLLYQKTLAEMMNKKGLGSS
ncbi:MAG: DUF507 family protein [Nitrospirae bacterium]|nr:DUF507 family protein [Candidatus Troglogloeales bacterium]MBI3597998.1 DUF507 family protein [Candidatus Troglogloeales bacterium]